MYDLTFFSVLEIKGSLLSNLNQTSYPEIDSKCHDESASNVQNLTELPSCEHKNRKLFNVLKLTVKLRGSYLD